MVFSVLHTLFFVFVWFGPFLVLKRRRWFANIPRLGSCGCQTAQHPVPKLDITSHSGTPWEWCAPVSAVFRGREQTGNRKENATISRFDWTSSIGIPSRSLQTQEYTFVSVLEVDHA